MIFRLFKIELLRLRNRLPQITIYCITLLMITLSFAIFAASSVYSKESFSKLKCAVFFPSDFNYNQFAFNVLNESTSFSQALKLISVDSIEEGNSLLESKEISFFVIIPENYISSILNGTNNQAQIIIQDVSSIEAASINELFIVDATMLGVAQAGVYAFLDFADNLKISTEKTEELRAKINSMYLSCFVGKESVFNETESTSVGNYSLANYYLGVGLSILLFFMSFILLKQLTDRNKSISDKLKLNGIRSIHLFLVRVIITFIALFYTFFICFIGLLILKQEPNPFAFVTIVPSILIICVIINLVCFNSKSPNIAVFALLIIIISFYYVAGGLLPLDFLPTGIKKISIFSPATYIINGFNNALWR